MWVEYNLAHLAFTGPTHLTIGVFDGVHRGHQALIRQMAARAQAEQARAVLVTFDPSPRQFFGNSGRTLLTTLTERLTLLAELPLDGVIVLPFDRDIADTPARAFTMELRQRVGMTALWAGEDFALGRNRTGDLAHLQQVGAELGFTVRSFAPYFWQNAPVRSTVIREALLAGEVEHANGLLGRPYQLSGIVVHGEKRGRGLGFPTANIETPPTRILPGNGVYVCRAYLAGRALEAVTNVGARPTFDHNDTTVEAYLLDFSANIYGATLALDFLTRLRPERKFASAQELVNQMRADTGQARCYLDALPPEKDVE